MRSEEALLEEGQLADAFAAFISASARLERSYGELKNEVAQLTETLSQRNQALADTLSEKQHLTVTLERILASIPCGVLVVGEEGTISLANPEAVRLLDLCPTPLSSLGAIRTEIGLDLELEAVEPGAEEQELCIDSRGGKHWVAVRKISLYDSEAGRGEEGTASVFLLRDISARKRMELEREAARDAVALAQVSAVLAHEIRNPLASLELFAGLLAEDPQRSAEWLSSLRAGIRSLSGIVNNVLAMHGGGALHLECVDVATESAQAVEFLQPLAAQYNVQLVLHKTCERCWCLGNRAALQQILFNLCANALRFSPRGGQVELTCFVATSEGAVRVRVADQGCGMRPEDLDQIFEPGFSGTGLTPGLGLAVCRHLVRQHGGALTVESRLGHGSVFTLELPQA